MSRIDRLHAAAPSRRFVRHRPSVFDRSTAARRAARRAAARATALAAAVLLLGGAACRGAGTPPPVAVPEGGEVSGASVRLALFNVRELSLDKLRDVDAAGVGRYEQVRAAADLVQRVRPDVLVVEEIDFPYGEDDPAAAARAFADHYLATGTAPLDYPYAFAAPVNTGVLSGFDLNDDGVVATEADRGTRAYGDDSLGWGTYPGQYGMAVLSRLPLDAAAVRTFRHFLWRDLPGNHLPPDWYSDEELDVLPLSSKSHWDLPVRVAGNDGRGAQWLHLWISHPTPPVFDGAEDRNGRRNFDEIRFWKLYLDGAGALIDDAGRRGGYDAGQPFVVVGDLNADPHNRGQAVYDGVQAAEQLLGDARFVDAGALLTSRGAARHPRVGGAHPERSTVFFADQGMRIDHLIPGGGARAVAGGVLWPAADDDPQAAALAEAASDHHLVWLDLEVP